MKIVLTAAVFATLLFPRWAGAVTTFFAPHYYSRADSPFYQGIQKGTIYLEDFEDSRLNTPYAVGYNGGVGGDPAPTVDEDDGLLDGRSTGGRAWGIGLAGGNGMVDLTRQIHFNFSRDEQGRLPEFAGAVILGFDSSIAIGLNTSVLVYDSSGNEVTGEYLVDIPHYPRGTPFNSSIGDRFIGFYVPGGISSIWFPRTSIVDHLQYGYAIPEPAGTALLLAGLAAGSLTRRRPGPRR